VKHSQQPAELRWSTFYQWRHCFNVCLKPKKQTVSTFAVTCFSVTVMTFKAYVTVVINTLTYVSFHKVQREQPSGQVSNFAAVLLQIYFGSCMPKFIKYTMW